MADHFSFFFCAQYASETPSPGYHRPPFVYASPCAMIVDANTIRWTLFLDAENSERSFATDANDGAALLVI